MTSRYIDRASRVAKMTAALRRHITEPGSLEDGKKRQAAYIIEDVDPRDCIALDGEAFRIEGVRRRHGVERFVGPITEVALRW